MQVTFEERLNKLKQRTDMPVPVPDALVAAIAGAQSYPNRSPLELEPKSIPPTDLLAFNGDNPDFASVENVEPLFDDQKHTEITVGNLTLIGKKPFPEEGVGETIELGNPKTGDIQNESRTSDSGFLTFLTSFLSKLAPKPKRTVEPNLYNAETISEKPKKEIAPTPSISLASILKTVSRFIEGLNPTSALEKKGTSPQAIEQLAILAKKEAGNKIVSFKRKP